MGYEVVPQTGYRNFLYGGFLVKKGVNERLELAAEVFSHAREGFAAPQTEASTLIDAGGYYHFKAPGVAAAVCLWALGRRPNGKLRLPRPL